MKNTYEKEKITKMLKINKKDILYYFFSSSIILIIPVVVSFLK